MIRLGTIYYLVFPTEVPDSIVVKTNHSDPSVQDNVFGHWTVPGIPYTLFHQSLVYLRTID